ncbi:spore surface glycoprotein BclB, partial [Streptomyces sp. IF17]|nr:spore surface glycoprotein BclB [Streptomyces alkaliphilus]
MSQDTTAPGADGGSGSPEVTGPDGPSRSTAAGPTGAGAGGVVGRLAEVNIAGPHGAPPPSDPVRQTVALSLIHI